MRACPDCGAAGERGERYCGICGRELAARRRERPRPATRREIDVNEVRYELGMIYLVRGRYAEAVEIWDRILKDQPENREVQGMIEAARAEMAREGDADAELRQMRA